MISKIVVKISSSHHVDISKYEFNNCVYNKSELKGTFSEIFEIILADKANKNTKHFSNSQKIKQVPELTFLK